MPNIFLFSAADLSEATYFISVADIVCLVGSVVNSVLNVYGKLQVPGSILAGVIHFFSLFSQPECKYPGSYI